MTKWILAFATLATAASLTTASAHERYLNLWNLGIDRQYAWCALYNSPGDATNCGFSTLAQCRATVSGIGGRCFENPAYAGPATSRPHRRVVHRKTRFKSR